MLELHGMVQSVCANRSRSQTVSCATYGFRGLKRADRKTRAHEKSVDYRSAVVVWIARSTALGTFIMVES